MDRARTIIADFTGCDGPYDITVAAGTCLSDPTRINVSFGSFTCRAYPTSTGTMVEITAVAAEGYRFDGWKGSITGSQGNMSFVSNSSETITAEFSKFSASSQSLWIWVVVGIAALLIAGLLIYKTTVGKKKKAEDRQFQPDVEQQIAPSTEDGKMEQ
jgi:hypothetical protein